MNWVVKLVGVIATIEDVLERLKKVEAELEVLKRRKPMAVMMMDEQNGYRAELDTLPPPQE